MIVAVAIFVSVTNKRFRKEFLVKMGDNHAGQNTNVFLIGGITFFLCVIIHFVYKIASKNKKKEALQHEIESDSGKIYSLNILKLGKYK